MPRIIMSLAVNAFLILLGAQLSLIEAHSNTVAVAGSEVSMKCQTTYGNCTNVEWRRRTGQAEVSIFRKNQIYRSYGDRFSVDSSSGLVIKNVSLTDAGRYICEYIQYSNTITEASLLFVLEYLPRCSVRVNASSEGIAAEGDEVQFTCDVKFNASEGEGASMTWKSVDSVSVSVKPNTSGRLLHSIVAKRPGIPSFECITTFDIPTGITALATNIPTAVPCTTEYSKAVLYPVTTVTLTPSLSIYPLGSEITCSAGGYPTPSYQWQSTEDASGVIEAWRDIIGETGKAFKSSATKEHNVYRCAAVNSIRGKSFVAYSQRFQVNDKPGDTAEDIPTRSEETSNNVFAIAFFIGVLSALLVVCAVLFILTKMRYVHFHRPTAQRTGTDDGMQDYVNMGSATTHPSPVEAATSGTKNEGDETAYASLREERNAQHAYTSIAEIRK